MLCNDFDITAYATWEHLFTWLSQLVRLVWDIPLSFLE